MVALYHTSQTGQDIRYITPMDFCSTECTLHTGTAVIHTLIIVHLLGTI